MSDSDQTKPDSGSCCWILFYVIDDFFVRAKQRKIFNFFFKKKNDLVKNILPALQWKVSKLNNTKLKTLQSLKEEKAEVPKKQANHAVSAV